MQQGVSGKDSQAESLGCTVLSVHTELCTHIQIKHTIFVKAARNAYTTRGGRLTGIGQGKHF